MLDIRDKKFVLLVISIVAFIVGCIHAYNSASYEYVVFLTFIGAGVLFLTLFLLIVTRELSNVKKDVETLSKDKMDFLESINREIRSPLLSIVKAGELLGSGNFEQAQEHINRIMQMSLDLLKVLNNIPDFSKISTQKLATISEIENSSTKTPIQKMSILEKIEGLNVKIGIEHSLDDMNIYYTTLIQFCSDAEEKIKVIRELVENKDWRNYIIEIHGLKVTLLNIGMESLHDYAYELELAANEKRTDFCENETEGFLKDFLEFKIRVEAGIPEEEMQILKMQTNIMQKMNKGIDKVLIIDDDQTTQTELEKILYSEYIITKVFSGKDALELTKKENFDLILLDISISDMNSFDVLRSLKNFSKTADIPVILISDLEEAEKEEKGFTLGVADYIIKPFRARVIKARIKHQIQTKKMVDYVEILSLTDELTGLPNRRAFNERVKIEWNRARREQTSIAFLMIDIDNFKIYNDTYGHLQGDVLLKSISKIFRKTVKRSTDLVARLGGEEFGILLPNSTPKSASDISERLRRVIEENIVLTPSGKETKATISIGVSFLIPQRYMNIDYMINEADEELYKAKRSGRNKISMHIQSSIN